MTSTHPPMPAAFTSTTSSPSGERVLGAPAVQGDDGLRPPHTTLLVHGSFFLADCTVCEWTGSARRVRHTAVRDALRHRGACPGSL